MFRSGRSIVSTVTKLFLSFFITVIVEHLGLNWIELLLIFVESPNGNVSSCGKSPSRVQAGDCADVFMCLLCAATTYPHCQTTLWSNKIRLRISSGSMHHWLWAWAWYWSSPAQPVCIFTQPYRGRDTIKWESLLWGSEDHTYTCAQYKPKSAHLNHISSAWVNQVAAQALPPTSLSYLRRWRIDFTVGVWATVSTEPTAGCVPC